MSQDPGLLTTQYGLVDVCHTLTANDCSDPGSVRDFSSFPKEKCETRTTPLEQPIFAEYQLLQVEKKRYISGFACSLRRTEIRYNCGSYDHPELDVLNWGFDNPVEVSSHTCQQWLKTKKYRPSRYSPHGERKEANS